MVTEGTNVDSVAYGRSTPCLSFVGSDEDVAVVVSDFVKDADLTMLVLSSIMSLG